MATDKHLNDTFDNRYFVTRKLGSGGTTAAPIAKAVMEAILNGKSN